MKQQKLGDINLTYVQSYAQLRQFRAYKNGTVYVAGRTAVGDGGSGNFKWVVGNIASVGGDNDGTIIAGPGNDGYWERQAVIITPQMFGARGDGTNPTAEVAAVQAAMTAATGRQLHFPPGTYLHDDRIDGVSNVLITGEGRGVSILKRAPFSFTPSDVRGGIFAFIQKQNIIIRDLELDGNKANQTSTGSDGYETGIWLGKTENSSIPTSIANATKNVLIENVYVHDMIGNGIAGSGCSDVLIKNCSIEDVGDLSVASPSPWGIAFSEYTERCRVEGGNVIRAHHGSIEFWNDTSLYHECVGVRMESFAINGPAGMYSGYHKIEGCLIDNTTHHDPLVACMYLNWVSDVVVKNNRFIVKKSTAIGNAAGSGSTYKNFVVEGNDITLINADFAADSNKGIELHELYGGKVANNTVNGKFDYGIKLINCNGVDLSSNDLLGDEAYVTGGAAPSGAFHGLHLARSNDCRVVSNTVRGYWWGAEEVDANESVTNAGVNASKRNTFVGNNFDNNVIQRVNRGLGTIEDGLVSTIADLRARPSKPAIDGLLGLLDVPKNLACQGSAAIGDGGAALFQWVNDTVTADDGVNNIVPTTTPRTGLWRRVGQDEWQFVGRDTLEATADGFFNVAIPAWASEIRVEYDLVPNTGVMWIALFRPNGVTVNQSSLRLISAVIDPIENISLPLGGSINANRTGHHGTAIMDVRAGKAKGFKVESQTVWSTGVATLADHMLTDGVFTDTARVVDFDIVGVTSGAALANAFLVGSTYKLFARK